MFGAEEEEHVPLGVIVDVVLAVQLQEGNLTVRVNGGEEVYVLGYTEGGWAQVQLLATAGMATCQSGRIRRWMGSSGCHPDEHCSIFSCSICMQ